MAQQIVWDNHQEFESDWWGNCVNTYGEETKQLTYAHRMGLRSFSLNEHWPTYDMQGKTVQDLGGGPVSMLLKCINLGQSVVIDPCKYPKLVAVRYESVGIRYEQTLAERIDIPSIPFDECWIYNVLQHVQDPEKIIYNARASGNVVRLFEWINLPPHLGHPHELKANILNQWLGSNGTIENMNENGCIGMAYYGTFSGTTL